MKLKIPALLSLLLVFSSVIYASNQEGDIIILAEGYGSSKQDALLKAKREAIEIGIGTVLISQTEIRNFQVKKDIILSKTKGSVKKYDMLREEKQPDDVFYIKIKAVVSLASIKEDLAALKILLESMDKPRMMVMIEEDGKSAENAILDYLTEKEFELVDASVVAALMQKEDSLIKRATEGDPAAAAKIGAANGAEYVIIGKVTKSLMKSALLDESGMKSIQANITAKVVNCSNAKIIASKSANSAAYHVSEDIARAKATQKAANNLMDKSLFEQIVSSFQDSLNNGITIDVTIQNIDNYKIQEAVKKVIGELPEVVTIHSRSFAQGQLKLSIVYQGNTDSFCENIDGKIAGKKKLYVTDIVGDRVVINLK
ncbi:MAG: hypothetical protein KJ550_00850 [Proteobacteria bacterium]|nr:hypothetical protein [Desulfobacteraceae bacterium]MBU4011997.1 hypothetical protein [Pseudomonadota bacterium]MBU4068052.1 hypothetical protein [Pseudomonadota bacterium]MBU4100815.1 hypothetical protein [Pseudomonadota bacterium]MBU4127103.1 hypothetical protein [Pseudomonadota bacterium]